MPEPERTPLHATVTSVYRRPEFVVENLHFQSMPGLYVTANLYRPAESDSPRPAVLYVCGHSSQGGRNGNKVAYQSHGIWLAKHGYVCLMVDTLQLGEIAAIHPWYLSGAAMVVAFARLYASGCRVLEWHTGD